MIDDWKIFIQLDTKYSLYFNEFDKEQKLIFMPESSIYVRKNENFSFNHKIGYLQSNPSAYTCLFPPNDNFSSTFISYWLVHQIQSYYPYFYIKIIFFSNYIFLRIKGTKPPF